VTGRNGDEPGNRRYPAIAALGLVALFVLSRTALLMTSFDANSNWEEPVFAFSAGELAREGASNLFDHQDDLRHGGGLVLVLLGIPWFAVTGGELMAFKSMAIFWSTLTLCACIAIGWRYFSPRVGMLWGVLFCAGSGASARLNVTLVGSHPEALLPIVGAIACYLELARSSPSSSPSPSPLRRRWLSVGFGVMSLGAIWFAYISAIFVVPLVLCWLLARPRLQQLAGFGVGGAIGAAPWIYQNLVLRPHGATLPRLSGGGWFWSGLLASFGNGESNEAAWSYRAVCILALAAVSFAWLVIESIRSGGSERRRLLPFLLAPPLGALVFALAKPPFDPAEGYYNYRYFVPLQASIYWVIAIGLDRLWPRSLHRWLTGLAVVALALGLWAQSDLLGAGNWMDRAWEVTRPRGCYVFGTAEASRSPDPESAIRQLVSLTDGPCRSRALMGLGVQLYFTKTTRAAMLALRASSPATWPPLCTGFNQNAAASERLDCNAPAPITPAAEESGAGSLAGYNLILINIDTLRSDHLSSYGYRRRTSPFLDRLASAGVVFDRARANSSFTRESVSALMTGRLPTIGGSIGWDAKPSPEAPVLGEWLRDAGYRTGFFSNTVMLTDPGFTRGFEEVHHLAANWGISRAGPQLSAHAIDFVRRHADEPFALYLHYLDPHGPYMPPEENLRRFTDHPLADPVGLYTTVRMQIRELLASGFGPGEPRFEDLVMRYDAEISHTDESIEVLFSALQKLGLLDRTAIVVTADHGEEFLEHGFVEHGWTLYEESLRVPLIFWAPAALHPRRIATPASSVDVLPTLMTLMGIEGDRTAMEGRSLLAEGVADDDRVLIGELLIREQNMLRTVVSGDWKYTAVYRWLEPDHRGRAAKAADMLRKRGYTEKFDRWPTAVREELYNLRDDPGEQNDLAATASEPLQRLRAELDAYRARCEAEGLEPAAPDIAEPLTEQDRERLRALGYL